MKELMIKTAGLENSGLDDPRTGLPIYVSTTVRLKYREYYSQVRSDKYEGRESYQSMRNPILNSIIAQDFAASANGAIHMFPSNTQSELATRKRAWIEIRKFTSPGSRPFNLFFSIISSQYIGIIKVSTSWKSIPANKRRLFIPRF